MNTANSELVNAFDKEFQCTILRRDKDMFGDL